MADYFDLYGHGGVSQHGLVDVWFMYSRCRLREKRVTRRGQTGVWDMGRQAPAFRIQKRRRLYSKHGRLCGFAVRERPEAVGINRCMCVFNLSPDGLPQRRTEYPRLRRSADAESLWQWATKVARRMCAKQPSKMQQRREYEHTSYCFDCVARAGSQSYIYYTGPSIHGIVVSTTAG